MINDHAAGRALLRDKLLDGLRRAERTLFTRPAPKSAHARMKFLRTREGGSSKSLAERLGVSRKTVDRYLSGATKKPQKRLQAALEQETEAEWQPQVKAQARARAATSAGLGISITAYFALGPAGTSDAGRKRDISVAVTPSHAAAILAAKDRGATDTELHDLVAEAIADAYFRVGGGGRAGLKVQIVDVERLEIAF
ncbi:helix-turn-helix transcriptional regulator [Streptomyces sp. KS 21]|uniref:telomere-protecting terminal protein Tpg n=1 Tax=Streptomyces sp. KS 21 TaxID=2485150 RepID=UPI0010633BD4|nr:helix-turn-helix transcriptional regulator [Streptomyces sp. KS 21]TDU67122.1 helix-turn-helix protein [Streptomyces sp. KS 21]